MAKAELIASADKSSLWLSRRKSKGRCCRQMLREAAWLARERNPLPRTAGDEASLPFSRSQSSPCKANDRCRERRVWPRSARSPPLGRQRGRCRGYRGVTVLLRPACPRERSLPARPGSPSGDICKPANKAAGRRVNTSEPASHKGGLNLPSPVTQFAGCWEPPLIEPGPFPPAGQGGCCLHSCNIHFQIGVEKELFSPPLCHLRMKKEKNK